MSQTHSLAGRLAISAISLLVVDRFGHSLQRCHLEFDKEAIYDGWRSEKSELLMSLWTLQANSFSPFLKISYLSIDSEIKFQFKSIISIIKKKT